MQGNTNYENYLSSSGFLNAIYHVSVDRQGVGVIVRLILPIVLLIYLAGLTFWEEYSQLPNEWIPPRLYYSLSRQCILSS